jgi:thiol:disulfide interchange protein DsbA
VAAIADDSAESSAQDVPRILGDTLDPNREPYLPPAVAERLELRTGLPTYVAGVHYETLAAPAPTTAAEGQVEVCEFFMFGCIHCFAFEPILTSWVESREDSVDFVRVPVMFNDVARLHAQAYYTAEALGVVDTIVGPFYSEIHERGQMLSSVDEIRKLFASLGVDAARFDATFESEEVRGDLRRAEELNRLYGVDATPTIGVAGKYRTSAAMAGSNEALFEVVDSLVESEVLAALSSGTESCVSRNNCPATLRSLLDEITRHAPRLEPAPQGAVVQ